MRHIQHPYLSGSVGLIPDPRQRYRIEGGYIYTERLTPLGFRESGDAVQVEAITGRKKPDGFISSVFNHGDLTIVTGNRDWTFERVRNIRGFLGALDPEKASKYSVGSHQEDPVSSPKKHAGPSNPTQQAPPLPATPRHVPSKAKLPRKRRFTASPGGIVEDQLTGLCWMATPLPGDTDNAPPAQFDWETAVRLFGRGRAVDVPDARIEEHLGAQPMMSIAVLGETEIESAGSQDWHLPTLSEFFSLVRRDGEFEAPEEESVLSSRKSRAKSLNDEVFAKFPALSWCSDERYVVTAWAFSRGGSYSFETKRKGSRLPVMLVRNG